MGELTSKFNVDKSTSGDTFFYSKNVFSFKNKVILLSGFKLNGYAILLTHMKNVKETFENDSSLLLSNAIAELSSLKSKGFTEYANTRAKIFNLINNFVFDQEDYTRPIQILSNITEDTIEKYNLVNPYYEGLITRVSFLDNIKDIKKYYNTYKQPIKFDSNLRKIISNKLIRNADSLIIEISKKEKMLMINESHYDYRNRLFITLLLKSLYNNGYRNLCLEALSDTIISNFPSKKNGFYILEPFMANLVRSAKDIGFNVYNYDYFSKDISKREQQQALNLYNLYKKDSLNKWIVLGGYDHINKYSFGSHKSMYQYFSELAGFAPLSINQSKFSNITCENNIIQNEDSGFFVVHGDSSIGALKQSDLYILNNINQNPFEQPFGNLKNSLRPYSFKTKISESSDQKYVFIYLKKEYDVLHSLAIPIYIGKIKTDITTLFLPEQDYISFEN